LRYPFIVYLPPVIAIKGIVIYAINREDLIIKRELFIILRDDKVIANKLF
jgi:hypothetical protein